MFLMCKPDYFSVVYDINYWMDGTIGTVNSTLAVNQWKALYDALSSYQEVKLVESTPELPDMVFTANAGIVVGKKAVVSSFKHQERQAESLLFADFFEKQGYKTCQLTFPYEGQGDHLVDANGKHWVGHGFRTSLECKDQLEAAIDNEVFMLELVDPRWYHLDTAFCPLSDGTLLWYPGAFSVESQQSINRVFGKQIIVSEQDAERFACNAICIDDLVIIPQNHEVTPELTKAGFSVIELDFSEYIKAGGAAKCLGFQF